MFHIFDKNHVLIDKAKDMNPYMSADKRTGLSAAALR